MESIGDAGAARARALRWTLAAASAIPLWLTLLARQTGDLGYYYEVSSAVLGGRLPYRDLDFEYPPYALAAFLPWAFWTERVFTCLFAAALGCADVWMKWILLRAGAAASGWRRYAPFALFTIAGWVNAIWWLKRYDLLPAALTLAAVWAASRGRPGSSAAALAGAIGTKVYAALLVPALFLVSRSRGGGRAFAASLLVAFTPLLALGAFLPWWRFAAFHARRGFQAESLPASVLWLGHHLGLADAQWVGAPAAYEVQGPSADRAAPSFLALWVVAVLASTAIATWSARRSRSPAELARLALLPILAMVAFGPVLSPQYTIWLVGLAALALVGGNPTWPLVVFAAAGLTRLIYPAPDYRAGLELARTLVLVARNGLLAAATVGLGLELARAAFAARGLPPVDEAPAIDPSP